MKCRTLPAPLVAILIVASACASGSGGGGGTASGPRLPGGETLRQGERPRQTENTRTAQRHLDRAEDAEDPAEQQVQYETALEAAERAIAEDEMNPLGHRQAALAAVGLERYGEAGAHFDRATELRPIYGFEDQAFRENLWIEIFTKAMPFVNEADYAQATAVLEGAHAIYKMRPEVMITLAQIYGQTGEHDLALERIAEAEAFMASSAFMEADSSSQADWVERAGDLTLMRAQVLTDADREEEAAEVYRTVVQENPGDVTATLNLAGLLVGTGAVDEAFGLYRGLMDGDADLSALDYYRIGVGFYNGNDPAGAASAFAGTVERSPNDRDALEMWTRSLADDSLYAEIPPVATRWLELDPKSEVAMLYLAQSHNQLGDDDATREAVESMEALTFDVGQLRLQRYSDGGAIVTGSMGNKSMDQGTVVTLVFTFYGEDGSAVGEVEQDVTLSAPEQQQVFRVDFASDQMVAGYGYRVGG